jgi:hypothetical protein
MKYTVCITFVVVAAAAAAAVVIAFVVFNQHQKHRFLTPFTFALYPTTCSFVTRQ